MKLSTDLSGPYSDYKYQLITARVLPERYGIKQQLLFRRIRYFPALGAQLILTKFIK